MSSYRVDQEIVAEVKPSKTDFVGGFDIRVIAFGLVFAIACCHGYCLTILAEWFLYPIGFPKIEFWHWVGLVFTVKAFFFGGPPHKSDSQGLKAVLELFLAFARPFGLLGMGFIAKLFLGGL